MSNELTYAMPRCYFCQMAACKLYLIEVTIYVYGVHRIRTRRVYIPFVKIHISHVELLATLWNIIELRYFLEIDCSCAASLIHSESIIKFLLNISYEKLYIAHFRIKLR